jgi:hypothetical protein
MAARLGGGLFASLLLALTAAPGASAKPVKTEAVLELSYHSSGFRQYEVTVTSDKQKCLNKRKVRVYRLVPGDDLLEMKMETQSDGVAFADTPGSTFQPGSAYYAKVAKRKVGGLTCGKGRSPNVGVAR